jgi:hypothetical protein
VFAGVRLGWHGDGRGDADEAAIAVNHFEGRLLVFLGVRPVLYGRHRCEALARRCYCSVITNVYWPPSESLTRIA